MHVGSGTQYAVWAALSGKQCAGDAVSATKACKLQTVPLACMTYTQLTSVKCINLLHKMAKTLYHWLSHTCNLIGHIREYYNYCAIVNDATKMEKLVFY